MLTSLNGRRRTLRPCLLGDSFLTFIPALPKKKKTVVIIYVSKCCDHFLDPRDPAALAYAIKRSCENKADVVSQDEKESGLRATLNLGHTFGHVSSSL